MHCKWQKVGWQLCMQSWVRMRQPLWSSYSAQSMSAASSIDSRVTRVCHSTIYASSKLKKRLSSIKLMSQSLCCGLRFYLWEIVGGVVRHCDLVMKIIFFPGVCWWFAKIYALKNFPLYGIPSLLDTEIHGRTLAALWSVNKDRDNDYKDLRPFLHALTLFVHCHIELGSNEFLKFWAPCARKRAW